MTPETAVTTTNHTSIGVAVSGGSDSLGMLVNAQKELAGLSIKLVALVVDHGLRDNSNTEAAEVASSISHQGFEVEILRWERPETVPISELNGKMRAARWARYALLASAAKRLKLSRVWVGHTREDQIETLWMRIERGTGLWGLAGLSSRFVLFDVLFERPCLGMAHADLAKAAIERFGEASIINDPTNQDQKTWRGKARSQLDRGLLKVDSFSQLLALSDKIGQWRAMVEAQAIDLSQNKALLANQLSIHPFSCAALIINRMQVLTQREHAINFRKALTIVECCYAQSQAATPRRRLTAGGVLITPCWVKGQKAWLLQNESDPRTKSANRNLPNRFWRKLFKNPSLLSHNHVYSPMCQPFTIASAHFNTTLVPNN